MGEVTKIAWCHHTWNPWRGCSRVSAGCDHCYAAREAVRNPAVLGYWGPDQPRVMAADAYWELPARWNAEAKQAGERRRVFLGSLMDFFEDFEGPLVRGGLPCWSADEPITRESIADGQFRMLTLVDLRERIWTMIAATPWLDWMILTKRPENFVLGLPWLTVAPGEPWRNVWLGVSAEDQAAADLRIPTLLKTPAAVRFVSCEPLLGPIRLDFLGDGKGGWIDCLSGVWGHAWSEIPDGTTGDGLLDLVIAGGESGRDARPMHPQWPRGLRDQCQRARTAFYFKQHGEWIGMPDYSVFVHGSRIDKYEYRMLWPDGADVEAVPRGERRARSMALGTLPESVMHVGKDHAGCQLDGREWREMPASPAAAKP